MKWLSKLVFKLANQGSSLALEQASTSQALVKSSTIGSTSSLQSDSSMNFAVHRANGGYVIECRYYPAASTISARGNSINVDHSPHTKLHIVTSEQDLGKQLSEIITYEALRT